MEVAHIFVSGFVQGVGFRRFIQHVSKKNNVNGWVTNLIDGRVEAILQGRTEDIEKVIKACKKGAFLSEVKELEVKWEEVRGNTYNFNEFKIIK